MNRPVKVILIDNARAEFEHLNQIAGDQISAGKQNSEEIQLLKSIKQKIEFIRQNPFYGDNIEKKKIPQEYAVTNLWRVELTNFWRMLYTIRGDQIEIICFILDIMDHPAYNEKFGYNKK